MVCCNCSRVDLAKGPLGMGSLGMRLGRKFLTGAVGDVVHHRVAKPKSMRNTEV